MASFLTASGGITNNGLTLVTAPSAVATYTLNAATGGLGYDINFSPSGLNGNQHSVGNVVNAIQTGRTSPDFVPIAAALFYQPDVKSLATVYNSLSGAGTAAWEQAALTANDQVMMGTGHHVTNWLNNGHFGQIAMGAPGNQMSSNTQASGGSSQLRKPLDYQVWVEGFRGRGFTGGDGAVGSSNNDYHLSGGTVGINRQISTDWLAGVALGKSSASYSVSGADSSGSFSGTHLAMYSAWRGKSAYVEGTVGFGSYKNSENRFVMIPGTILPPQGGVAIPGVTGYSENLRGQFDSRSYSVRLESGMRLPEVHGVQLTPFAAVQTTRLKMSGFRENQTTGASSAIGLDYPGQVINSTPASLGGQIDMSEALSGDMTLSGWLRLAWSHEFETKRTVTSSFISAPGYSFTVDGAAAPKDSAAVDVGLNLQVNRRASIFARFSGNYGHANHYTAGSVGLSILW